MTTKEEGYKKGVEQAPVPPPEKAPRPPNASASLFVDALAGFPDATHPLQEGLPPGAQRDPGHAAIGKQTDHD
jgi:hypothetical protein